jgi:hypothetical protein
MEEEARKAPHAFACAARLSREGPLGVKSTGTDGSWSSSIFSNISSSATCLNGAHMNIRIQYKFAKNSSHFGLNISNFWSQKVLTPWVLSLQHEAMDTERVGPVLFDANRVTLRLQDDCFMLHHSPNFFQKFLEPPTLPIVQVTAPILWVSVSQMHGICYGIDSWSCMNPLH